MSSSNKTEAVPVEFQYNNTIMKLEEIKKTSLKEYKKITGKNTEFSLSIFVDEVLDAVLNSVPAEQRNISNNGATPDEHRAQLRAAIEVQLKEGMNKSLESDEIYSKTIFKQLDNIFQSELNTEIF